MVSEHEAGTVVEAHLRQAVGCRVDAPEEHLVIVQGVSQVGRPTRPVVPVLSDGGMLRFVSFRRVAAVLPFERRIVFRPRQADVVSLGRAALEKRPA